MNVNTPYTTAPAFAFPAATAEEVVQEQPDSAWKPRKLTELGFVGRGRSRHRPRDDASLYGGAYPFVQTGDVKAAECYITDFSQTYNENGLSQSKLWQPGTLCITIAANIAETAILKIPACFPDSIVGFVADPNEADVRFIKYYIDTIKLRMQSISRGTTQDNLSLDKLLTFDILTPPLPIQRKIAAILSAYDDLIENNTRCIRILEEMARALYREWFVHFRFPGHVPYEMVESELGPIPQGWRVVRLGDVVEVARTGINPSKYADEEFAHYSIPAFDDGKLPVIEPGANIRSGKFLISENAVLVSKINPRIPRVWMLYLTHSERAVASTEFLVLVPRASTRLEFVYGMCQMPEFANELATRAGGTSTSHQRVKPDDFLNLPVILPESEITERFAEVTAPTFLSIHNLRLRNATLRQMRDLLLPKLVSGEVEVEGLGIEGGVAAATVTSASG